MSLDTSRRRNDGEGSQKRKRKENREEARAAYISFLLGLWPVRKR